MLEITIFFLPYEPTQASVFPVFSERRFLAAPLGKIIGEQRD